MVSQVSCLSDLSKLRVSLYSRGADIPSLARSRSSSHSGGWYIYISCKEKRLTQSGYGSNLSLYFGP